MSVARSGGRGGWAVRLGAGSVVAVAAVLSQYLVPPSSPVVRLLYGHLVGDLLIVYGIPILAFALLIGAEPLRDWRARTKVALPAGLGWYGALSLLSIAVIIVLVIVYEAVDRSALDLLNRPIPVLQSAASDPWLYIGLSFLVGGAEEVIFRGWMFGTWTRRTGTWVMPAIVTSAVFAGVHLYYGLTFGVASPFFYPGLFLLGFAFAATYHTSGGNLLVPALLHGLNDAISFFSLVSTDAAAAAHYLFILGAAVVGLVYYLRAGPSTAAPPGGRAGYAPEPPSLRIS